MGSLTKEEIKRVILSHKELLKKYNVKSLALFGSSVRGEMTVQSDIDFLVEFDKSAFGINFEGYSDNYFGLLFSLEEIFKTKIDLLTIEMISPYMKPFILKEAEYFEAA
jgi:predicted nucleotidyltransferase